MKMWMYCKRCERWYFREIATVNRCVCGSKLKGANDEAN